ncbi:hypothetical protein BH10CHL1_BH10CHL1_27120 [soil metagenome]
MATSRYAYTSFDYALRQMIATMPLTNLAR